MSEQVNNSFIQKLGHIWCGLVSGHHNLTFYGDKSWHLRCMHCGYTTSGWLIETTQPLPLSSRDITDVTDDLTQIDLHLHGGG